ncbi:MAG TPA: hypothetical protein GXX25_09420 [Desulfotomaculum sp.]|nr:hypothetical protein [Desulfotomaculum sp.]
MNRWLKAGQRRLDELSIMTVYLYLVSNRYDEIAEVPDHDLILEALKRSTTELGDDATYDDMAAYLRGFDEDQIQGVVNNVKGIYHEMKFVEMENCDHDRWHAELIPETNHPATDVRLIDLEKGKIKEVSLKATDHESYVQEAQKEYPGVPQYVTEEVAHMRGVHSTGLRDDVLTAHTEEVIGDLREAHQPTDFIPHVTLWTAALALAPAVRDYREGRLDREALLEKVVKVTGMKLARAALFLSLLSFPVTAMPTMAYLIYTLLKEIYLTYKEA